MAKEPWLPTLWGDRKSGDPFTALRKQIDDLFSDFGSRGALSLGRERGEFLPGIDVSETDKEMKIAAELPGMTEKDVEVTMSGDTLTIKGEKRSEIKEDDKDRVYHRIERSYGMFQRSLRVPFQVEPDKVAAEFKNGVLTVTLTKPEEARSKSRKIEIKPGS